MGCFLPAVGLILGLILGPFLGMILAEVLSDEATQAGRTDDGFVGFLYGLFCGPFVGMVALPTLYHLIPDLVRRSGLAIVDCGRASPRNALPVPRAGRRAGA